MKKFFLLFTLLFALPLVAQDVPAAPQPQPAPKQHNFFLNKLNTPIFVVQAAGAFWQAREVNGNASEFTNRVMWHRYLPNAYRDAFGEVAAGMFAGYMFHKSKIKHHEIYERITLGLTAGALYITADRYLKSYNKQDCLNGLQQFCH